MTIQVQKKQQLEVALRRKNLRRATKNIITPGLAAALDRTGISSRRATFVLTEAAKSLGHQTEDIAINRMSIHRQRKQHRAKFVKLDFLEKSISLFTGMANF